MIHQPYSQQVVPGAGVDSDPSQRPGVPMETEPKPVGHAHWTVPERQESTVRVLKDPTIPSLTPVFSTAMPPRGLSGLVRRLAYRIPAHRSSRWMILLFADRVDVIEHGLARTLPIAVPAAAAGFAVLALARRRRRPWPFR